MKHKILMNPNEKEPFLCICGKMYKHMSSLCNHKNECVFDFRHDNFDMKKLVMDVVKQNQELSKQIIELSSSKNVSIVQNNTTTIHNNKFNLQIFLNETCKDALNLTDFVDSLQLSLTDLENFGDNGFVDGISKIFVRGLEELDISKRPIHCSDLKRETMYIKNSDVWEKENEEKNHLKKAIVCISDKNITQIPQWKKENPEYRDGESKKNDQYMHIINESITKETDDDNFHKIIKNVAKSVMIDKTTHS